MIVAAFNAFEESQKFEYISHQIILNLKNIFKNAYSREEVNSCSIEKFFVYKKQNCADVWSLAKKIGKDVKKYILTDDYLRKLKFFLKIPHSMLIAKNKDINTPVVTQFSAYATTISNIGKVKFGRQIGCLEIDYLNVFGVRNNGRHFITITTVEDLMCYTLAYTPPKYKTQPMKKFFKCFYKTILDNILG